MNSDFQGWCSKNEPEMVWAREMRVRRIRKRCGVHGGYLVYSQIVSMLVLGYIKPTNGPRRGSKRVGMEMKIWYDVPALRDALR